MPTPNQTHTKSYQWCVWNWHRCENVYQFSKKLKLGDWIIRGYNYLHRVDYPVRLSLSPIVVQLFRHLSATDLNKHLSSSPSHSHISSDFTIAFPQTFYFILFVSWQRSVQHSLFLNSYFFWKLQNITLRNRAHGSTTQ